MGRATADHYGATICAENFIMHSSTNGLMCGAVFRIMNKQTSTVTWRPEWRFISYSGWGERASITVNGNNNWSDGGCHGRNGGCTVTPSLNIPANSAKNRISTVIFVSGGTNYYGWGAWNWRANLHMFRNGALKLPSGLATSRTWTPRPVAGSSKRKPLRSIARVAKALPTPLRGVN